MALREAVKHSKGKPNAHAIASGVQLLQDDKVEGNEELDILRKKAYTVVWSCASQTQNELKKKARVVVEKLYDSGGMSFSQCCSLALWLLETHQTEVTDGTGMRNIPNFIFGGIELVYKKDKSLDTKRSKVDPLQPFKSLAIPEVIYQYWGLAGREQASMFTCIEEFKKVPNNLIALTCNAIKCVLTKLALYNQPSMFSNKLYAEKWDALMSFQEALEEGATEYFQEMKEEIWEYISSCVDGGPKAMKSLGNNNKRSFVPILQLLPKKEKARGGRATQAGGSTASIAATKSNVAAVAGSSRIAAMSSEHDRNEDKDVQEESPEPDELEPDDLTSGGEPEPSDVE
ncbi:hypothetical protein C8Q72DRAFT_934623 [Fomitopsis betulina]|nr:hypothetical protein C8Q72DRAFT_934623 [Fomitopsis betulina]